RPERAFHRVHEHPGPAVGHPHLAGGGADRARAADQSEKVGLPRPHGDRLAKADPKFGRGGAGHGDKIKGRYLGTSPSARRLPSSLIVIAPSLDESLIDPV